jgi:REP element-mobilizing transposase RayT
MPRQARKKSKTGIYHIMVRGINRQTIFEDDEIIKVFFICWEDKKRI